MILHVGSKQIDNCYLNIRSRNRLIELGFIIYKYSKETTRKRRSETIEIYNKIFNDTYTLLDKFKYITKKPYLLQKILEIIRIYTSQ